MEDALKIRPNFSVAYLEQFLPLGDEDYMAHYVDGLRKAGAPEE